MSDKKQFTIYVTQTLKYEIGVEAEDTTEASNIFAEYIVDDFGEPVEAEIDYEIQEKELPERINAMKVISYDVQQIVETLMAENEIEAKDVTLEMVKARIQDWVEEDFAHDNADSTIFQDENGEEL